MFTVGEFSQLAQVSKRLLRYYDEIGLLVPVHVDRFTGYRYYSAEQLPDLNRILALKDLGLSLEQIRQMLVDKVSAEEMQGMLLMKKAEVGLQLQAEAQRIRSIESRLQAIRNAEAEKPLDVVVKHTPALPVLSVRSTVENGEAAFGFLGQVMAALPEGSTYGLFFGIWHRGGLFDQDMDVEIGRILKVKRHDPVSLGGDRQLSFRELPAVPSMATFVVTGPTEGVHIGYSAIGAWAETNGYRFTAPPRELALQMPQLPDRSDGITEIQFPVEPVRRP